MPLAHLSVEIKPNQTKKPYCVTVSEAHPFSHSNGLKSQEVGWRKQLMLG